MAGELIDRGALQDEIKPYLEPYIGHDGSAEANAVWNAVKVAPTIDAVQVVHARWEPDNIDGCCTACGGGKPCDSYGDGYEPDYCQYCGARMDADAPERGREDLHG